ncbi:MAG TPA: 2'-deoxycytidine 5'-triphosphate deaminase [Nitrospinota bacterium]|nr:2'-deoxycytidine 5'-triphosphate deaminase [Nitrospinota bacterium]|tara:strand:+ start:58671 stop:59870 length:1200 start_codon:yes stop_codon:yes gene_type:complete
MRKRNIGILPNKELTKLINNGKIRIDPSVDNSEEIFSNIQPASLDLTLGDIAYRIQCSFLPQSQMVQNRINDLKMYEVDLNDGAILEKGAVYLVPLREELDLPKGICGKANPKSSTGRLDVFTRVITDNCFRFDDIADAYKGKVYLEVVPLSFTVKVKTGQTLNQLRLFRTSDEKHRTFFKHEDADKIHDFIKGEKLVDFYVKNKLLYDQNGRYIVETRNHVTDDGLLMSIDLINATSKGGPVGYKAKKNSQVIDIDKLAEYKEEDFWEPINNPLSGHLILEPEEFYIFASKELIRVPTICSAEMVEFDAGSGELRTHYAGFFDPGFGYGRDGEILGTRAVLEVRPHDVPFRIEDGQILFKIRYEMMSEAPDIWYGPSIGSNYHSQGLRLGKQFSQRYY